MNTTVTQVEKLKIGDVEIYLEDFGEGKGKIILSNPSSTSYSYYWNAMGGSLKEFLCQLNGEYFARCLIGANDRFVIDWKKTFAEVRKHIRNELSLPWYSNMEFQIEMRHRLNRFQRNCVEYNTAEYFVHGFDYDFVNRLDFYLIEDNREYLEKDFKRIDEVWHFLVKKEGPEYLKLIDLLKKLQKILNKKAH